MMQIFNALAEREQIINILKTFTLNSFPQNGGFFTIPTKDIRSSHLLKIGKKVVPKKNLSQGLN